ncbi:hypothetical protein LCD52_20425 [Rossellomorea vietnamensis]|uniref:hypothetical protein n=1 Tax=Rossellomorea vietnamensis TaxID=218284 RepID=UPI001CCAD82D|nr:hypothetical protein [Rossellomorea vietnamensis]MCA0151108.1 hypothetical protein [Rossellomorea vietnamensis]
MYKGEGTRFIHQRKRQPGGRPSIPTTKLALNSFVIHTNEFRESVKSTEGDRALVIGAKALALTVYELLTDKGILEELWKEFGSGNEG